MKEITLIFAGLGYDNINQAYVEIYDINNNLILKNNTYNGRITICLKTNDYYKVKVYSLNEILNTIFYLNNYKDKYFFALKRATISNNTNTRTITLLLTDFYYENLPIEKGSLIIWQKK